MVAEGTLELAYCFLGCIRLSVKVADQERHAQDKAAHVFGSPGRSLEKHWVQSTKSAGWPGKGGGGTRTWTSVRALEHCPRSSFTPW